MNYFELAKKYKTPFYLYDFAKIRQNYEALKRAFFARKNLVFYAVKANPNLSILRELARLDAGFDCVSANEIKRALRIGAKPYKIIFSGVGKSKEELLFALECGILFINIESKAELLLLESLAKKTKKKARISVRVNPNVDAKSHPYICTGLKHSKFGVSEDLAKELFLYAHKSPFLEPIAIHFHIGSQLLDISPIIDSAKIVAKLAKSLIAAGVGLRFFDIGGGVGVKYHNDDKNPSLYDYAQGILAALQGMDLTICLEPGRQIVANSGKLITSVIYEKKSENKRFVIVDAAMSDLARPALYDAYHEINLIQKDECLKDESLCDVVGGVCESSDFLAKDRMLPPCKMGDLIVIKMVGAYGFSMSSNYNSRNKCAQVGLKDNKTFLIRKQETFLYNIALEEELCE